MGDGCLSDHYHMRIWMISDHLEETSSKQRFLRMEYLLRKIHLVRTSIQRSGYGDWIIFRREEIIRQADNKNWLDGHQESTIYYNDEERFSSLNDRAMYNYGTC